MQNDGVIIDPFEFGRLQTALAKAAADHQLQSVQLAAGAARMRLLEEALDTVPVGVLLADPTGQITHGNTLIEKIVRHPVLHSDDVDSYGEWVSFHPDGRRVESHEYPLSRVLRDGENFSQIDVNYQRGDGTMTWLRIIGRPVRDDNGETIGASVALIDISSEREHIATQQVLIGELNHRVKNVFSVVKSIVSQSLRTVDIGGDLRETIDRRLDAYAQAHARLIGGTWERAPLGEVANDILAKTTDGRLTMTGPEVSIPLRQALALSMAFYELSTNAWKHGALSVPTGHCHLSWTLEGGEGPPMLRIEWAETGGPVPKKPSRRGFGSIILKRALEAETRGRVKIEYPVEGFRWTARLPVIREKSGE